MLVNHKKEEGTRREHLYGSALVPAYKLNFKILSQNIFVWVDLFHFTRLLDFWNPDFPYFPLSKHMFNFSNNPSNVF